MKGGHLVAAVLAILLGMYSDPSFVVPEPNVQVEHKLQQETVAPSKHALVVGASSGIGLDAEKQLAPIVAKLAPCSRSYPAELLETIKMENANVGVVHEKLDVSLIHEVHKLTTKHSHTQFNWIVMSPGFMTINGRTETSEGFDVKMATHYYGRDLMAQALFEHAPSASFMHASPGFVNTGLPQLPGYLRVSFKGLAALFARTPDTCGKYMVSTLLNDEHEEGWTVLNQNAQVVSKTKYHTEEVKDMVWKHTLETIEYIMKHGRRMAD